MSTVELVIDESASLDNASSDLKRLGDKSNVKSGFVPKTFAGECVFRRRELPSAVFLLCALKSVFWGDMKGFACWDGKCANADKTSRGAVRFCGDGDICFRGEAV